MSLLSVPRGEEKAAHRLVGWTLGKVDYFQKTGLSKLLERKICSDKRDRRRLGTSRISEGEAALGGFVERRLGVGCAGGRGRPHSPYELDAIRRANGRLVDQTGL